MLHAIQNFINTGHNTWYIAGVILLIILVVALWRKHRQNNY